MNDDVSGNGSSSPAIRLLALNAPGPPDLLASADEARGDARGAEETWTDVLRLLAEGIEPQRRLTGDTIGLRWRKSRYESSGTTAVRLAELSVGPLVAADRVERAARQARLQQAEADFEPLAFDATAARAFGR